MQLNKQAIGLDSKSKVRYVHIWTTETEDKTYLIHRESGLIDGKKTQAPDIEIAKGKVKRTLDEQCELEFNSNFKKYLDKGYKDVSDLKFEELTSEKCAEILGETKTDQNGALKPMLCKLLDKDNKKLTDKEWYGSYKHDGVRMLLFMRDGEVHTSSRGGGDYDIPATYIREDSYIIKLLTENEGLILDGELYRHGWNLQKISGLARKETLEEDHKQLCYHCYDIVDESATFKERVARLNKFKKDCPSDSKLIIIEQRLIKGLDAIMDMHNEAVAAGYEGLVIKDPDKEYKCGARDNRALKIKEFQDDEFRILGIVEGLRDEDMCFLMETKDGTQFKAKPIGDRLLKQQYRDDIDNIVGKLGTVKFFGWTNTEHPVPNLPSFRAVRYENDI